MSEDELREYLAFAEDLARQAGEIAKKYMPDASKAVNKDDNSPVTIADEKINQLVIDAVKEKYPGVGVLGEEISHKSGKTSGLLWVCDPIDGTIPYILGVGMSTFMLALVEDGKPVVGVIYNFLLDELFSAANGLGAQRNGQAFISERTEPMPIVAVEGSDKSRQNASRHIQKLNELNYKTPNFVSSGFEASQVALGNFKGLIYSSTKPWDVAAAKIIFDELGMMATDLDGNEQRYDQPIHGVIFSNGDLHEELLG